MTQGSAQCGAAGDAGDAQRDTGSYGSLSDADEERVENKNVIITGGTTGIGLAAARLFAAEGATVTVTGSNPQRLEFARQELRGIAGQRRAGRTGNPNRAAGPAAPVAPGVPLAPPFPPRTTAAVPSGHAMVALPSGKALVWFTTDRFSDVSRANFPYRLLTASASNDAPP